MQMLTQMPATDIERREASERWSVHTCSEKDVAGSGVPGDDAHTFGVALQHHNGLADRTS